MDPFPEFQPIVPSLAIDPDFDRILDDLRQTTAGPSLDAPSSSPRAVCFDGNYSLEHPGSIVQQKRDRP